VAKKERRNGFPNGVNEIKVKISHQNEPDNIHRLGFFCHP